MFIVRVHTAQVVEVPYCMDINGNQWLSGMGRKYIKKSKTIQTALEIKKSYDDFYLRS